MVFFLRCVLGGPMWCFCSPCVRWPDMVFLFAVVRYGVFVRCVVEVVRYGVFVRCVVEVVRYGVFVRCVVEVVRNVFVCVVEVSAVW